MFSIIGDFKMNFEFREARDVSDEIKKFIFQNPKSYNFGNKSNINEPIVLPEGSKVYECYFKENLVAFIILVHCFKTDEEIEDNYFYEIIFGKLTNDENVKFKEILKQFLQNEYKEDLKIFAVVKNTNEDDKDKVFNILEENGFVTTENPNERIFIPNNNCQ